MTDQIDLFAPKALPPPIVKAPDGIHDDVLALFERYTFIAIRSGAKCYSSDAILHRIRWHHQIERGNRDFKCNNDWTAGLARWFMAKHPEHDGFFETRERRKSEQ